MYFVAYLIGLVVGALMVWTLLRLPKLRHSFVGRRAAFAFENEELEFWRLPCGGVIGVDASYLDQVEDSIICPYTGERVLIPEYPSSKLCDTIPDQADIDKYPYCEVFCPHTPDYCCFHPFISCEDCIFP